MKNHPLPLLFGRRELVEGNGFVASVILSGRALLTEEDDEHWVEGVNPGGFSANGQSAQEALGKFCDELRAILYEIALEAPSFEAFKAETERFYDETNNVARAEWESAVLAVRAGEIHADWLVPRPADSPQGVEVRLVREPRAENNREGEAALAA